MPPGNTPQLPLSTKFWKRCKCHSAACFLYSGHIYCAKYRIGVCRITLLATIHFPPESLKVPHILRARCKVQLPSGYVQNVPLPVSWSAFTRYKVGQRGISPCLLIQNMLLLLIVRLEYTCKASYLPPAGAERCVYVVNMTLAYTRSELCHQHCLQKTSFCQRAFFRCLAQLLFLRQFWCCAGLGYNDVPDPASLSSGGFNADLLHMDHLSYMSLMPSSPMTFPGAHDQILPA